MTNLEIRLYALKNNVKMYQIAERLGIHYVTLNNKLRKELTNEEKEKILKIIDDLSKKGDFYGEHK